jgi:hypothetical protein
MMMDLDLTFLRSVVRTAGAWLNDLRVVRPRRDRDQKRREARRWSDGQSSRMTSTKKRIVDGYAAEHEAHTGEPPGEHAVPERKSYIDVVLRLAAVVLCAGGAIAASVHLYAAANLTQVAALTSGAVVAAGAAFVAYAFGKLLTDRYQREPQTALAVTEGYAKRAGLLVLFGIALFFGADLIAQMAPTLTGAFDLSVIVCAVGAPLLAGLLLTTADLRGWSVPYAYAYRLVIRAERVLADLDAATEPDHERDAVGTAPFGTRGGRGGAATAGAIVLMLAAGVQAAERPTAPAGAAVAPVVAAVAAPAADAAPGKASREPVGRIFKDDSGSPDPAITRKRIEQFLAMAPGMTAIAGRKWQLFRFYGQSFETDPVHTWELPPYVPPACDNPKLTGRIAVSARGRQDALDRSAQECEKKHAQHRKDFDTLQVTNLEQARKALLDPAKTRGTCTALRELFERFSDEPAGLNRTVIVISDGAETCHPRRASPIPPPPGEFKVVMVVVPPAKSAVMAGDHFQKIKRYWGAIAPWVTVVSGSSFGPDLFTSGE